MRNHDTQSIRTRQKEQTRAKILKSARRLLEKGKPINLEDVAYATNISRATIYRYFSNLDTLYAEARSDIQEKSPVILFQETKHLHVVDRILHIQAYYNDLALTNEAAFKKSLSIYLKEDATDEKITLRDNKRLAALKLALSPIKNELDAGTYNKIITVTTALMGIEPVMVAKDVCQTNNHQTKDALAWGLEIILRTVL